MIPWRLLEQIARLEHGGENFAQTADPRLHPPHMVEHVLEIGPHIRVERRKREVRQLVADLVHRSQHALEPDQLASQCKEPADFFPFEKGVESALLTKTAVSP